MNRPNADEIRAKLEQRRERDSEARRQQEEAMDALAVEAVQSVAAGLGIAASDVATGDGPPVDTRARAAAAGRAIQKRREQAARSSPSPQAGEPPLRAALRGVIGDYAEPLTPSDQVIREMREACAVAIGTGGPAGRWEEVRLADSLAVRAAMPGVVEAVTAKVESIIIAELVAAEARLAQDHPDAPWPDESDPGDDRS